MTKSELEHLYRHPCPYCKAPAGSRCVRVMTRFGEPGAYLNAEYIHSSRRRVNNYGTGEKLKITHLPWPIGRSPS